MRSKEQKKLIFNNKCGCIVDLELLEKAMLWYSEGNLHQKRAIYLHAKYPCVSIYNRKIHVHRLIMYYTHNTRSFKNIHVHHVDGNKLNAAVCNLELMDASEHISKHNKGKKLTPEHRAKIATAGRLRKGISLPKRVFIPKRELIALLNDGATINRISILYKHDRGTIKSIISRDNDLLKIYKNNENERNRINRRNRKVQSST